MNPALNAWTLPKDTSPEVQLRAAAEAGFTGLELVVGRDDPLRPDTPPRRFVELARTAGELGIAVTSLATGLFWDFNYSSSLPADRQRATDLTLTMLDQAAAAGAGAILVVPAVVGYAREASPQVSYGDALHRTHEALLALRHDAEARGVSIALENVWNRFLLSPVEFADLLDRVNSPSVGAYFDVGNALAFGYPEDWIHTLGRHIVRVHAKDYDLSQPGSAGFCALGEGSVNWPRVVAALRGVGYDGPLVYEGAGELADIRRRLERILAFPDESEGKS